MIWITWWTEYTAFVHGRVMKLVPCENCSTEYVYALEREGIGDGISLYNLNDEGAQDNAESTAESSLREYLENDFDAVPCPACGQYQRHMFAKLYEAAAWLDAARLVVLMASCLGAVFALYCSLTYLQKPSEHTLERMATAWAVLAFLVVLGVGLGVIERSRSRQFDPNIGDPQARIEEGRRRALTRAEFEAVQQREQGVGVPDSRAEAGADPG